MKDDIIKGIGSNKIVFAAGSNILFGIDTKTLQNAWGMPVVNYGVHAGLGLTYLLHKTKTILKEGDIVILPLEYTYYQFDSGKEFSEVLVDYAVARDAGYYSTLPWFKKIMMMIKIHPLRLYNGLKYFFVKKMDPDASQVYNIKNISSEGDQINIEPEKMTKREINALARISPSSFKDGSLSAYFLETMREYLQWAAKHNICVILMPAGFLFYEEYLKNSSRLFFKNLQKTLAQGKIQFIGDPYNYMYDKSFFFDTEYHLNSKGKKLRTAQILKDIGQVPYKQCGLR